MVFSCSFIVCNVWFSLKLSFNSGRSHPPPASSLISRPSYESRMLSSFPPMSTMLYSISLQRVTVGRVCPGFSKAASSLVSSISKLGEPIRSVPFSHCCFARRDSSRTSSNQGSPVTSPSATRISFIIPITTPRWCIQSSTGFRLNCVRSMPSVRIHVP